jgi:hypothetical protein
MSRPRLFETKKFGGCQDRDQPRLSKSCRDRDFIESLANHWQQVDVIVHGLHEHEEDPLSGWGRQGDQDQVQLAETQGVQVL